MISNQVSPLAKAIFRIDDVAGLLQSGEKYYMKIDEVGAGVFLGPDFIVSLTQHNTTQHNTTTFFLHSAFFFVLHQR